MIWKKTSLLRDPGFLFASANALLFLNKSFVSFIIVILALGFIVFAKVYGKTLERPHSFFLKLVYEMGKKPFMGLEVIGYACFCVAFVAMTQQDFISFMCAFCFGLANVLLAMRFSPNVFESQENWTKIFKKVRESYSLTPLFLALLLEPIFLICLGFVHAGLAAGDESLWIFPLICWVIYLVFRKMDANRVVPQGCLCVCALWYTLVAGHHGKWILALSNLLCTLAYLEIALQEQRVFLAKLARKR